MAMLVIALLLLPCRNRASIVVQVTPGTIDDSNITKPWKTDYG